MTTQTVARIEADDEVPMIHIYRDFDATVEQLIRAHTDPDIFVQWVGPRYTTTTIDYWDARSGGSWRYIASHDGEDYAFHGCFHEVGDDRIVQTFTWEGQPDGVALESLTFTGNSDGTTSLHATSLVDSFASRDAWLSSGMEVGVNDGYAKLAEVLVDGVI